MERKGKEAARTYEKSNTYFPQVSQVNTGYLSVFTPCRSSGSRAQFDLTN